MSTDPRFDLVQSLIQTKHFAEALAKVKELEECGATPESTYAKGQCLAGLGRISEARVVVRHLKEAGQVGLAQRLADHIVVEEPPQGLIDDEPYRSTAPPYPTPAKSSNNLIVAALAVGAIVLFVAGVAIGKQFLGGVAQTNRTAEAPRAAEIPVVLHSQVPAATEPIDSGDLTGNWQSVDFVAAVSAFTPGQKQFRGDLYLKDLTCNPDGSSSIAMRWRNGWITDTESNVRAQYFVKRFGDGQYLFLPWISGDVTIRGQKPQYYVMKKTTEARLASNAPYANAAQPSAAQLPAVEQAQWVQVSTDISGSWRSVDFVAEPSEFKPGSKFWQGDFFLKGLECYADGSTSVRMTWGGGWIADLNSGYKASYEVWSANGNTYLFLPWISGDVTIRGQKPQYYVMQRI